MLPLQEHCSPCDPQTPASSEPAASRQGHSNTHATCTESERKQTRPYYEVGELQDSSCTTVKPLPSPLPASIHVVGTTIKPEPTRTCTQEGSIWAVRLPALPSHTFMLRCNRTMFVLQVVVEGPWVYTDSQRSQHMVSANTTPNL